MTWRRLMVLFLAISMNGMMGCSDDIDDDVGDELPPTEEECLAQGYDWCGGQCLEPCAEGEIRDANCDCIVKGEDPVVIEVFPENRAEVDHEDPEPVISATFSVEMDPSSFGAGTTVDVSNLVTYSTDYDAATKKLVIQSGSGFAEYTTYRITIKGGEDGVKSLTGVAMESDFSWKFYTKLVSDPDSIVLPRTGIVWWTFASGGSLAEPMTSPSYTNFGVVGQSSPLTIPAGEDDTPCSESFNYTNCSGFIWHMEAELD